MILRISSTLLAICLAACAGEVNTAPAQPEPVVVQPPPPVVVEPPPPVVHHRNHHKQPPVVLHTEPVPPPVVNKTWRERVHEKAIKEKQRIKNWWNNHHD